MFSLLTLLGERERAHLVAQPGRFFYIYNTVCQDTVKCFHMLLFHRHISTFHGTQYSVDRGSVAGSQASQNDRESIVLLKLLNTISVAPSNIQLDMLSSKC